MTAVLITGAGVHSPLGSSVGEFMRNLENKTIGVDHIENFNTDNFPVNFGAEVRSGGSVVRTEPPVDRKAQFIRGAMAELVEGSPDLKDYPPAKRMLHLGAGLDYFDLESYTNSSDSREGRWQNHYRRSNRVVEELAAQYHIDGGYSVNVAACVASTQSMGLSYRILQQSPGTAVITGGFDSMLCHLHYMGFYKLGAFSSHSGDPKEACKPFDKNRSGLVLGEGGIAFMMQRSEDVRQNTVLVEICGYSSTMDAYKVTDPHPGGEFLAKAALEAIAEAGLTPEAINCVHLHGTGTPKNGAAEARAMETIFGKRFKEIPVFSLKAQVGHLIGACGAMEMLAVIYSLQRQAVPPTLNFSEPDPDVPLRVVIGEPLPLKINYILKLNSGFGGQNTAIIVRQHV